MTKKGILKLMCGEWFIQTEEVPSHYLRIHPDEAALIHPKRADTETWYDDTRLIWRYDESTWPVYRLQIYQSKIEEGDYGVHRTHCCAKHGCKYGDENCPVVLDIITQDHWCEYGDKYNPCFPGPRTEWDDLLQAFIKSEHFDENYGDTPAQFLKYLKDNFEIPKLK